jgi:hypothetical protein
MHFKFIKSNLMLNRPISGAPSYSTGGPSYNTGPGPQADMFSRRAGGTVPSGGYQVGGCVNSGNYCRTSFI